MLVTYYILSLTSMWPSFVGHKISIKADLNKIETEACGKCALCYMNGDYCSECTQGDGGCPVDAYIQMEAALSALKEE